MFGEWAERISTAPISSQAARRPPTRTCSETASISAIWLPCSSGSSRRARIVPCSSTSALQPGGSTRVDSGSSKRQGPSPSRRPPARRVSTSASSHSPPNARLRCERLTSSPPDARGCGCGAGHAQRDADRRPARPRRRGRGSRSGARARRRRPRPAPPGRARRSPRSAARRTGRGSAARRCIRSRRPSIPSSIERRSSSTSAARRSALSSSPLSITVRAVSRRRSEAQQAERREHAAGPRADDPRDAQLVGDRRGVHRPGAAERQQREVARVDAALDRDHAQRPDHLLVGDADDALGRLELARGRAARRAPATAASRRLEVELDVAGERGVRRRGSRAARFASVTVGSVPPRP